MKLFPSTQYSYIFRGSSEASGENCRETNNGNPSPDYKTLQKQVVLNSWPAFNTASFKMCPRCGDKPRFASAARRFSRSVAVLPGASRVLPGAGASACGHAPALKILVTTYTIPVMGMHPFLPKHSELNEANPLGDVKRAPDEPAKIDGDLDLSSDSTNARPKHLYKRCFVWERVDRMT